MRPTLLQLLRCFCAIVFVALLDRANARSSPNFSSVSASTNPARFTTPSSLTNDQICEQVRNIFTTKQLQSTSTHPSNATAAHGNNSTLCSLASTCCNSELEARFDEMVTSEFHDSLQTTTSYLKNLMATNADRFKESFLSLVQTSENSTSGLFADVYKRMSGPATELIEQLYGSLSEFLKGVDVDPSEAVSNFFDGLFPLVYLHTINPKVTDFNDDYKECLRETQAEVRPFGDLPPRLSTRVARALQAARTFLQALHLGVEVLNSTDHLELAPECTRALTRLLYCPLCQGLVTEAKACNGYCLNVVRGCLAIAAELDQPWNEYVAALQSLATGMKSGGVLDDVTSSLHTKISEAIMHAMENGPELYKKVKKACGHPERTARDAPVLAESDQPNTTALASAVHSTSLSLSTQMQSFLHTLQSADKFYFKLANTLCNDGNLAVHTEVNCWNGETIGEYTKTIAGVGLSAQKYNPELKMQSWKPDSKISQLADKLKHMKQILNSRTVAFPESDSLLVNDGSGSGWRYNGGDPGHFDEDDEDYSEHSGSGEPPGTEVTYGETIPSKPYDPQGGDIDFTEDDPGKGSITNPPVKEINASTSISAAFASIVFVVVFSSLVNRLNG